MLCSEAGGEILHEVALNLSDLRVRAVVCACHVPLRPCQAPEGRLSKGPRDATHSRARRGARQGRRSILQRGWDDAGGWQRLRTRLSQSGGLEEGWGRGERSHAAEASKPANPLEKTGAHSSSALEHRQVKELCAKTRGHDGAAADLNIQFRSSWIRVIVPRF